MDSRDINLQHEILLDRGGKLILEAIKLNDAERLQILIKNGAKISNVEYLELSAELQHWKCTQVLIKNVNNYTVCNSGQVLLLAAKANEFHTVQALLNRVKGLNFYDYNTTPCRFISWRTKSNKYNSLHWAVYHNNAAMCELFLMLDPIIRGSNIYERRNQSNETPLEMAFFSIDNTCMKSIAKGMWIGFVIERVNNNLLFRMCIEDIRFGYVDRCRAGDDYSYGVCAHERAYKAQNQVFLRILDLPKIEKEKALLSIFNENTTMNSLFELWGSMNKYKLLATEELIKLKTYKKLEESTDDIDLVEEKSNLLREKMKVFSSQMLLFAQSSVQEDEKQVIPCDLDDSLRFSNSH